MLQDWLALKLWEGVAKAKTSLYLFSFTRMVVRTSHERDDFESSSVISSHHDATTHAAAQDILLISSDCIYCTYIIVRYLCTYLFHLLFTCMVIIEFQELGLERLDLRSRSPLCIQPNSISKSVLSLLCMPH